MDRFFTLAVNLAISITPMQYLYQGKKSRGCSSFLIEEGGSITCEVVGHKKLEKELEVPCIYKLTGNKKAIKKEKGKLSTKKVENVPQNITQHS